MCSYAITPVIVIAGALFWTTFKGKLNAVETFTTLAFILLIQVPLAILLKAYPSFTATLASLQRIQNYLLLEEKHDTRLRTNEAESQQPEQLEKVDLTSEGGSKTLSTAGDCVIKFSNVTISRNSGGKLLLNRSKFSITRCQLVMVAGSVGCGKSTLLEAILGEVSPTDGSIYVEKGVVAYCAQVPWLRNLSIRDNIIGDSPDSFDSVWYREVLSGCLLVEDLSRLPGGDQYKVGSGGVNLSGGQRHRVVSLLLFGSLLCADAGFLSRHWQELSIPGRQSSS
jgi:ABC-type multidrug transport system fused ATPase/permease subunit